MRMCWGTSRQRGALEPETCRKYGSSHSAGWNEVDMKFSRRPWTPAAVFLWFRTVTSMGACAKAVAQQSEAHAESRSSITHIDVRIQEGWRKRHYRGSRVLQGRRGRYR